MKRTLTTVLTTGLLLTACGGDDGEPTDGGTQSTNARTGVVASYITSIRVRPLTVLTRPSQTMGVFVSSYLAQGAFIDVHAAVRGVEAQRKLLEGQSLPATSETFALLQELGTILQVDVADMLNRSGNRGQALDEYISSLKAVGTVAVRKRKELEQQVEIQKERRQQQRSVVRDLESELRDTLRNEDYGRAAGMQEEVTAAESELAQTEARQKQSEDILDRYEELLEIAEERLRAIENNRKILIAGLRVVEVPGIENLGILDASKPFRTGGSRRDSGGDDIFGTEFIRD